MAAKCLSCWLNDLVTHSLMFTEMLCALLSSLTHLLNQKSEGGNVCMMKKTKWQIWFLAILYHEKEIQRAIYGLRTNWSSTKGSVKDSSERHVLIHWQMITTLTLLADETVKEMNSVACRTSRLSQQVHGSFHQHQECFPPLLTSETHDPSHFCYWSIFHKCLSVRHTSLHQIVSCGFDWQCCRRSD